MLLGDGQVKVLDFGLARVGDEAGAAGGSGPGGAVAFADADICRDAGRPDSRHGSVHEPRAGEGACSPTSAATCGVRVRAVQMLTGTRAFGGEDVSDVLATVLKSEPDWAAFPPTCPLRSEHREALSREGSQGAHSRHVGRPLSLR